MLLTEANVKERTLADGFGDEFKVISVGELNANGKQSATAAVVLRKSFQNEGEHLCKARHSIPGATNSVFAGNLMVN